MKLIRIMKLTTYISTPSRAGALVVILGSYNSFVFLFTQSLNSLYIEEFNVKLRCKSYDDADDDAGAG